MGIKELRERNVFEQDGRLFGVYNQLTNLLAELRKRELPDEVVLYINSGIDLVNSITDIGLRNQVKKTQADILKLLEKELKLVAKNHYRSYWMAVGPAGFGLPLGIVYGSLVHNMGMMAIGLPFGLIIGMAVGASMDNKALKEGRQLDIEIKY